MVEHGRRAKRAVIAQVVAPPMALPGGRSSHEFEGVFPRSPTLRSLGVTWRHGDEIRSAGTLVASGDQRHELAGVEPPHGAATYERLKRLKRAYDSDKVFRLNQNIGPD